MSECDAALLILKGVLSENMTASFTNDGEHIGDGHVSGFDLFMSDE